MFIRIKKITKNGKNYPYACVVENRWMKKTKRSRQKVKKYLGRVYFLDRINNNNFFEFYSIADVKDYVKNNDKRRIIDDLIRFELIAHGFKDESNFLVNGKIYFDKINNELFINNEKIKNSNVVLAMNEGFLCDDTIKRLFGRFDGNEKEVGFKLANAFVEAGLKIPEEIFIGIFEKVINK